MPFDTVSASPARQELASINELTVAALDARDAAQQAVNRFERPVAEVQIAREELAALKSAHDAEIVAWYEAGCVGDRPEMPLKLLRLEQQLGQLARNVDAVAVGQRPGAPVSSALGLLVGRRS
jgi:hypothetical protein